jgi:hypothetical protein
VPEHLLHGAQIGTALEQMRGEGMSQGVWRHAPTNPARRALALMTRHAPTRDNGVLRASRKRIPRPLPRSSVGRISRVQPDGSLLMPAAAQPTRAKE